MGSRNTKLTPSEYDTVHNNIRARVLSLTNSYIGLVQESLPPLGLDDVRALFWPAHLRDSLGAASSWEGSVRTASANDAFSVPLWQSAYEDDALAFTQRVSADVTFGIDVNAVVSEYAPVLPTRENNTWRVPALDSSVPDYPERYQRLCLHIDATTTMCQRKQLVVHTLDVLMSSGFYEVPQVVAHLPVIEDLVRRDLASARERQYSDLISVYSKWLKRAQRPLKDAGWGPPVPGVTPAQLRNMNDWMGQVIMAVDALKSAGFGERPASDSVAIDF